MNSARDKFQLWESATTQDIMENPEKFGAPTLEQFIQRRNFYQKQYDSVFGRIDLGGKISNRYTDKQLFEIDGYRCKSLEEVERIARSEGIDLDAVAKNYTAEFQPLGGGKATVLIRFMSPEYKARLEARYATA